MGRPDAHRHPFRSAAWYYARFRPPYPDALFDLVRERFRLDGTGRMLDLGCGPGHLAIPLAGDFEEVIGLDPEPEMLAEARRIAGSLGVRNVRWVQGASEDLPDLRRDFGAPRLVTMGHSFGWMDRDAVLRDLDAFVARDGGLALVEDGESAWDPPDTMDAVNEVLRRTLGEVPVHGSGGTSPNEEPDDEVLARSPFARTETHRLPDLRETDVDRMIGFLYSTSFASHVHGARRERLERDLRATLIGLRPSGRFGIEGEVVATLAWRS